MSNSLIAGAAAGAVCDLALHPIDTIKTRMQSSKRTPHSIFRGIYNGVGAVALSSAPASGLFFYTYDSLKASSYIPATSLGYAAAAGVADTIACFVRVPFEVIKQRSQAISGDSSSWGITRNLIKREGPSALFNGFGATVLRDVPFSFIQFPIYEALKSYYRKSYDGVEASPFVASLFGSLSGGIAAAITCPLDVVKTRLMLGKAQGIFSCLCDVWREEGLKGWMKGVGPRVAFISAGGWVWFGTFEKVKELMGGRSRTEAEEIVSGRRTTSLSN